MSRLSRHWFGVEPLTGVDLFALVAHGARTSLLVGLGATVLGTALGVVIGVSAGYLGGWWDRLVTWTADVILGFPYLIFMIALGAVLPVDFPRQVTLIVVLAFVTFVVFYVLPADPARMACGRPCTPEGLQLAREFMGYDVPWYQQFFDFLGGIAGGRTFGTGTAAIHCTAPCFGWFSRARRPSPRKKALNGPPSRVRATGTYVSIAVRSAFDGSSQRNCGPTPV